MQILTPEDTARALPYDKLVPAIAQAARELASGAIDAPERMVVKAGSGGVLLCMPALGADLGVTKLITVHGGNPQHGLPAIQGEVLVFETSTGRRLALLDGPTVTARRTAAVTLLGIQTLLPGAPASALLIGTGVQAVAHADALIAYFGVSRFRIASRDPAHAQAFCNALMRHHPQVTATAQGAQEARTEMPDTDLVIALTTSTVPVVPARLPAGTLAAGVGAFKPEMAELPPELLRERDIVVDDLAGAKHEAGDLLQAGIEWSRVRSLAAVLADGRPADRPLPVLKTVGQAAWDLAAARTAISSLG
ncbi:MAG TPA: delta(1)-pyrroline-2-carboxylate reductase family protein [Noviherbaspirillum sp.]|uniref:delta(1)-pyrroline-2-carboxylate reductase family protein n=1 Tax=Noviherbaspirillum sp. TaxID=1926288 RepID=UPI002D763D16|nr:delta(1)-pyrroline-2-carboxylate reductase family protein [Noviherbaspirillum sp.]HYD96788.1 delta(1)-pyrroline-2-carboxylate reductase family protein [Noviherbaspirillum sp.]